MSLRGRIGVENTGVHEQMDAPCSSYGCCSGVKNLKTCRHSKCCASCMEQDQDGGRSLWSMNEC